MPRRYSNRGNILQTLKRFDEALADYARAIDLQPGYAVAHFNRGNALQLLKRFEEAVASYERALELQPDLAEARLNQSLSRLMIADFEGGWPGYEWRFDVASPTHSKRGFSRPQWTGREDISGKTIYLHAEQGLGDTIQFCRYVPLVAARGARVILEVSEPLVALMATLAGSPQVVNRTDEPAGLQFPMPIAQPAAGVRHQACDDPVGGTVFACFTAGRGGMGQPGSGRNGVPASALPGPANRRIRAIRIARFRCAPCCRCSTSTPAS